MLISDVFNEDEADKEEIQNESYVGDGDHPPELEEEEMSKLDILAEDEEICHREDPGNLKGFRRREQRLQHHLQPTGDSLEETPRETCLVQASRTCGTPVQERRHVRRA